MASKPQNGGIKTLESIKLRMETLSAEAVKDQLEEIVDYAVMISPVSTGAYVNSFSLGKVGFGGGRSVSSVGKESYQDAGGMKQQALGNLLGDIGRLNIEQDLQTNSASYTFRNSSPHVYDVEDGLNWKRDGYHVFEITKVNFR